MSAQEIRAIHRQAEAHRARIMEKAKEAEAAGRERQAELFYAVAQGIGEVEELLDQAARVAQEMEEEPIEPEWVRAVIEAANRKEANCGG